MEDLAVDKIVNNGVGLVDPEHARELYEGLHSHLQASGIDGVKVDVIHLLEMLCEEYGGRVELAKAYFQGLTESVCRHFGGNGVIASMEHCNDFMLLGTEAVALGRVGDDFWFSGVLGAFNCQGGGWSPEARRNKCWSQCSVPVTARAGPADVEWTQGTAHPVAVEGAAQFAVYFVEAKKLELLLPEETAENTGGAVQAFESSEVGNGEVTVEVAVKGAEEMAAYSSAKPRLCKVEGEDAEFAYKDGVVTVAVPWSGSSSKLSRVEYVY
uniref:Uncharacterized protein n=1 Tax=Aegilops tauschii TaxID=37682 RepID=R7W232_AEGTA